jgi:hypothetical protein
VGAQEESKSPQQDWFAGTAWNVAKQAADEHCWQVCTAQLHSWCHVRYLSLRWQRHRGQAFHRAALCMRAADMNITAAACTVQHDGMLVLDAFAI